MYEDLTMEITVDGGFARQALHRLLHQHRLELESLGFRD